MCRPQSPFTGLQSPKIVFLQSVLNSFTLNRLEMVVAHLFFKASLDT